ncbi:unnamed protein product [Tilletia controversa]|nr:unnamed protein product [Tilletia controversa]
MKLTLAFVALLQLADVVTSQRHGKASNAGPKALGAKNAPPVVPRGYLVEFVSNSARKSAESSGFTKHEDRTQHDALHSFLTKRKSPVQYRTRFTFTDSRIFSGLSLILDNDKDVNELRAFPGVKKVHPLRIYMPAAFEPTIVSPEFVQSAANVHMYRIFACGGGTSSDIIMAAMEKGFFDGVDVLSLSLGGPNGWVEDPSSAVASKIVALGTPVIVSHGNDGEYGAFYASGPAAGLGVTGVGSVDNEILNGYSAKLTPSAGAPSNGNGDLVYLVGTPFTFNSTQSKKLKLYATSTDPTVMDDGCAPLPSSTPDLKDYVVVIARGTCMFVTKFTNAYNAGARYVFIYNSAASITYLPEADQADLQAAMLTRPDGLFIVNALAVGKELYIDFTSQSIAAVPDTGNGGFMSSFSTYGLTWEAQNAASPTTNAASVQFSSETVTILPGKSQDVSMTFKAPVLDTSTLPIYSGFISIKSSISFGSMHVPYSGVGTKLSSQQVLDTSDSALGFAVPALLKPDGKTVITDDQRVYSLESSESQPTLVWRLLTGTLFYSIDLVDGNTTFVPTISTGSASSRRSLAAEHKHVGVRRLSGMDLAHSLHAEQHRRLSSDDAGLALQRVAGTSGSFNDVKIIGNLDYGSCIPRNNIYATSAASNLFNQFNLEGNYTDADGVDHRIQNGTYRILLRARRLLATDAKAESSYESYLTHAFTVKRA